jgi:hypothetical protein
MQYKRIEEDDFIGELIKDVEDGTCISRPLINLRYDRDFAGGTMFFLPDNIDDLVKFLFDLSLGNSITYVNRVYSDNPFKFCNPTNPFLPKGRIYAYEIYYRESQDGTTNITAELIEHLYRAFHQEDCK